MSRNRLFASVVLLATFSADNATAQPADTPAPQGIYFNRFSGPFFGNEWLQIIPIDGADRFRISDIFGGGFDATIAADGTVTLDGGAGSGTIGEDGRLDLQPTINNAQFTFAANRAPSTAADVSLWLPSGGTVAGDVTLDGSFRSTTRSLNPQTGQVRTTRSELLIVTVLADTLRITDADGSFYQGVFIGPGRVAFRSITPMPADARFRSFPASLTSVGRNVLGELAFDGADRFSGVILLQSIQPLGRQDQTLLTFDAARIPVDDGLPPQATDPIECARALCGMSGTAMMLLTIVGMLGMKVGAARGIGGRRMRSRVGTAHHLPTILRTGADGLGGQCPPYDLTDGFQPAGIRPPM